MPPEELGSLLPLRPYGREGWERRDETIRELWGRGTPVLKLAKRYGLSQQAVYRILWRGRLDRPWRRVFCFGLGGCIIATSIELG